MLHTEPYAVIFWPVYKLVRGIPYERGHVLRMARIIECPGEECSFRNGIGKELHAPVSCIRPAYRVLECYFKIYQRIQHCKSGVMGAAKTVHKPEPGSLFSRLD